MQKIIYENPSGKRVEFSMTPPYIFEKVSGIQAEDAILLTTEAPGQHGKSFHGLRMSDREINLSMHIKGNTREDMYRLRRELIAILSSGQSICGALGRLEYYNDAGSYCIPAIVKIGGNATARLKNYNSMNIVFYCPNPFFRAMIPVSDNMAYLGGGFEFPLEFPEDGVTFGSQGYQSTLDNAGDFPAPLEITITGPATEPQIMKVSTGEYIKVKRQLFAGDTLYLNTERGNRKVMITRQNGETEQAFGYLDLTSTFFQLDPGENDFEYHSGDDTTNARVTLIAYPWYGGV